jgi:21S rRNA (GM2251-2'-O)-methyltransferase
VFCSDITPHQVVGTSSDASSTPLHAFKVTGPTILVMGSEGFGLRTVVRRQCDVTLRIDGGNRGTSSYGSGVSGTSGYDIINDGSGVSGSGVSGSGVSSKVDSLNVSVSTGIILHHIITMSSAAATTAMTK